MSVSKKFSRGLAATALSGALVAGGAAAALAVQVNVDGGTWNYGTGGGKVWSNYHHPTKRHGSSVQGKHYADSGCVNAGQWSYASAPDRSFRADHSYYRFC
ncbi:lactococcin 972 family bacteriocin [Corynebacterium oculi]|uniref:Bacteriocin n=1 Tax=Corynebacterium oculi TaxID=1544416 RepID=A0A0Q1DVJ1_9CORY|nr:lactococcin 972 family bacteriocin [Corynebacterium oculi]KQB84203.1 Bacteriocin [Corynebacterium oculi]